MPDYWKNQYRGTGTAESDLASGGVSGTPRVSATPQVSPESSQDLKDVGARDCAAGPESSGRRHRTAVLPEGFHSFSPSEAPDELSGAAQSVEPHVHRDMPDEWCADPACLVQSRECQWCGVTFAVSSEDEDRLYSLCSYECWLSVGGDL